MTRPSPITEERIRERAYRLWVEEGRPHGKDAEHWQRARELLALEADREEGRQEADKRGKPVEPVSVPTKRGEFPTMTDGGEPEVSSKRKTGGTKRRPTVARRKPM
jgi:hypothetical protein